MEDNINDTQPKAELVLDLKDTGTDRQSFRKLDQSRISKAYQQALATPQGKTIATGLLTFMIIGLLLFFAIAPALGSINAQLQVNTELLSLIKQMDNKLGVLLQLSSQQTKATDSLKLFDSYFGPDKHQGEIYTEITSIIDKNSLSFQSIDFVAKDVKALKYANGNIPPKVQFQTISIKVRGTASNIASLIGQIEASKRNYTVQQISLSVPDKKDPATIQGAITFYSTYWATITAQS